MGLALELVETLRHLAGGEPDRVVLARMRLHVADTVGIALAARRDPQLFGAVLQAMGGHRTGGGATVLGGDESLPPSHAAFVNAALAHAMDFDDIHDVARLHPTPVSLAAVTACAPSNPSQDETHPGRWLTAVLVGNETMCRLGRACAPAGTGAASNWFLTQLFGALGAAVAAGWALGLNDAGLEAALGFACMQASGSKEAGFGVGSNARQIYPAFAAMNGVVAAQLAAAGLTAPATAIEGAGGLLRSYLGRDADDALRASLLARDRWDSLETSLKPWPCCRLSHPYVSAALALRASLGQDRIPAIRRLVIGVNASAEKLCLPLPARIRPTTLSDAKYSVPFMTAWTLVHGAPSLDLLDARALEDEKVLSLASTIEIENGLPDRPGHPPARLQAWSHDSAAPIVSSSDAPPELDTAGAQRKFLDAARYAGHPEGAALWRRLLEEELSVGALLNAARLAPEPARA